MSKKAKPKSKAKPKARRRSVIGVENPIYDGLRKVANKHKVSLQKVAGQYLADGLKKGTYRAEAKATPKVKSKPKASKPKPKSNTKPTKPAPKPAAPAATV